MTLKFKNNRFLVIGRAGLDLYADPPGTQIEQAHGFSAALGGSAANIAVAICKQGGTCALLTAVSSDAVGRFTINAITTYGVDTRYIKSVGGEARNSLAVVETRAENCQSVIYRNNAADFQLNSADVELIDYSAYAAVVVTGTCLAQEPSRSATIKSLQMARNAGLELIIDIDYRPYSWRSKLEAQQICLKVAEMCDVIVGNDEEFAVLSGEQNGLKLAAQLAGQSDRIVIYKMGGAGCTTFANGERFETPVFAVTALKPTGAGDAFMGGLISGLTAGVSVPDAVRRGAATAAIVVTRVGCAPAMPTATEVETFVRLHQD